MDNTSKIHWCIRNNRGKYYAFDYKFITDKDNPIHATLYDSEERCQEVVDYFYNQKIDNDNYNPIENDAPFEFVQIEITSKILDIKTVGEK